MKVAIIGSGISGLAAAHTLHGAAEVTLFESGSYFGGHTHTVDVTLPTPNGDITHGVDTGFLVFNERTYPELIKLFANLDVVTAKSEMSFSVQSQNAKSGQRMEWSGTSLNALFAQRSNLISWRFWRMLGDIQRFNSLCTTVAGQDTEMQMRQTVGEFLMEHRFSDEFRDGYFLPMAACIWSCPMAQMLEFPMATMIRFCHNHGLLQITHRPQWWTVQGGAKHYVEKITASITDKRLNTPVRAIERLGPELPGQPDRRVRIATDHTQEYFDAAIIATHSDEALALLKTPTQLERTLLGAIKYHANRAVLHTDATVLPTRKAAWAAWNYERAVADKGEFPAPAVCLHYLLNRLQPLPWPQPVVVSLNPLRNISEEHVLGQYAYSHPVFDTPAIKAQRQIPWLQGQQNTYFCGAWMGYGFHEDGLKAGQSAASQLLNHHGQASP
jgi:uncharacterized protein